MTKILIIEDDSKLSDEIATSLRVAGFEVQIAKDGIIGVQYALQTVPDLIVCNLSIPKLDGYGVFLELRADPVTSTIPVIFVASGDFDHLNRPRISFESEDFLVKPFNKEKLLKKINRYQVKKKPARLHFLYS